MGGYDDQFNDGVFRAGVVGGRRVYPRAGASVSMMRGRTSFRGQGLAADHDIGYGRFVAARPQAYRFLGGGPPGVARRKTLD